MKVYSSPSGGTLIFCSDELDLFCENSGTLKMLLDLESPIFALILQKI